MAKKPSKKLEEITKKYGDERKKALDDALKSIEKDFGKGAVMRLGERAEQKVQVMSSGSLSIDIALGAGGYPKGRIVEIYGPESSGKTTVALHAVAQCQKEGGIAAFIDAEHALDPAYAAALGVNIDELLLSQPDSGEQGLEIASKLIDSGAVDLVVVDSVAALVPRAEIDGDIGDSHVGLQARMMSQAMRKLGASINKTKTIAIFINQLREKVGVMFGNPETTPGGRALKFYASVRLDVRGNTQIKGTGDQKDQNVGKETKVKVVKNKVAPPFKEVVVEIMYGEGISQTGELIQIGSDLGIIKKAGAWYSYNDEKIGQGSENAKKFLAENPEIFAEIDRKIRIHYGLIEDDNAPAETADTKAEATEEVPATETETNVELEEVVLDLDGGIELEE
ncbi:recombinase RecA [Streptococcus suis]